MGRDATVAQLAAVGFRMPARQHVMSRKTSLTNAFASAIIPMVRPTSAEVLEALAILGMTPDKVCCSYCGDASNTWDHFRPVVIDRLPTGYISEIANFVPACGPCNSSKGNAHWHEWINRLTGKAPRNRGVPDLDARIERLHRFEAWREPVRVDFAALIGGDRLDAYWRGLDEMIELAEVSHAAGVGILAGVMAHEAEWRRENP